MIPLYLLMMTACLVQTDDDLRCTRRDSTPRAAWRAESASEKARRVHAVLLSSSEVHAVEL